MKLHIEDIKKSFGDKEVLKGCSGVFEQGRIYGLLGRNGAGKTTLFKAIYGDFEDFSGRAEIEEDDGSTHKLNGDEIGMIFSQPMIPDFLTGYEFIKFYSEALEAETDIDALFGKLNFDMQDRDRLIKGYSSGMKSKLHLMTLLISKPPVMLLDEPLTSLDVVVAEEIKNILLGFKKNHIIIFSTHIMQLAKDMCDEIVLLKDGVLETIEGLDKASKEYERKIIEHLTAGETPPYEAEAGSYGKQHSGEEAGQGSFSRENLSREETRTRGEEAE